VDKLSVVNLFTVNLPDTLMISLIGLLTIGKFSYFKDKHNFIRIALFTVIAAVIFFFTRSLVHNVVEQMVISILMYSLLFIFVIGLKFYESIVAGLLGVIILVVIEGIYAPPLFAITHIDIQQAFANDLTRFLYTLPERFIQVIFIYLSFKFKIKIFDFDNTSLKKTESYAQIFVTVLSTATMVFLIAVITKTLLFDHGNIDNTITLLLLRLNMYISLFVTVILLLALKNTNESHKKKHALNMNEYIQSLDYLSELIRNEKLDEARNTIDNLKMHITEKGSSRQVSI